MGIFDLKIDKFNDFRDFLMKKLDFEAFLSKYRNLCYGNLKNVSKALKEWHSHACIIIISPCKVARIKN